MEHCISKVRVHLDDNGYIPDILRFLLARYSSGHRSRYTFFKEGKKSDPHTLMYI